MITVSHLLIVHSTSSSRAKHYANVRAELDKMAEQHQWRVDELELTGIPYHRAMQRIAERLHGVDLVIAAGGDGIAQVTFNAIYASGSAAVFATIPLGNGNDISRALNGRRHTPLAVLQQPAVDFYPLNIMVDGRITFSLVSYITFGATTVLVDYLNRTESRRLRQTLKHLSPAAALPVGSLNEISRTINELSFPDFWRDGNKMTDDSIGFFVIPAAHNVLRLSKDVTLASSEFFFHHAQTYGRNLAKKILMAGAWTLKFPGQMTELEELSFADYTGDITANVSGDNINLGHVTQINAIRSARPQTVLSSHSLVK